MRLRRVYGGLAAAGVWLGLTLAAAAQEGPAQITPFDLPRTPTPTPMVEVRPLQQDIIYIDQLTGEIPMDGALLPPPPEVPEVPDLGEGLRASELVTRLVLAAMLAAMLWALWRNREAIAERLTGAPRSAKSKPRKTSAPAQPIRDDTGLLAELRRMKDRRAALVLLLQAVLRAAAQQNGLRLGRSETARELLRRLPNGWEHLDPARNLVMTEELVQFGGRPLPDPLFEACLTQAAPILSEPTVSNQARA